MTATLQRRLRQQCFLTSLTLLLTVTSFVVSDVFTSSDKILELAESEGSLLEVLSKYISTEYENLKVLSQFLLERSKDYYLTLQDEDGRKRTFHPNEAFLLIKNFTSTWNWLTQKHQGLAFHLKHLTHNMPSESDYQGSLGALIRLQRVYRLSVQQMYTGNYSGYLGPSLAPEDTFLLGRQAFVDGYLEDSIPWLQLAVHLLQSNNATATRSPIGAPRQASLAQAASLLGRAYLFMNNETKAQELYILSRSLEPEAGDVVQLKIELEGERTVYGHNNKSWHHNMSDLCSRDREHRVSEIRPFHVCRYKAAHGLPYLTYKEEILSVRPYASLFYNVVHDRAIDTIKQHIRGRLFRGTVGQDKDARTAHIRTSDLGWIHDVELETVNSLSKKIKIITGLELDQRAPSGPSSAEAMQVVNYGLGGHYDKHMDPFKNAPSGDVLLKSSGTRLATFLIYLSDVERGGSTVFLNAGISVSPIKGMALFWYNFSPDMTEDRLTEHAGCPVLVGQKWIANKWIWTYGNTFRRPCGPHPNSTQLDIERLLLRQTANTTTPRPLCTATAASTDC